MCGIAVIVSGIRIDSCSVTNCGHCVHCVRPQVDKSEPFDFTLEDLKAALRRRGPDRLRNTKISLQLRAHASLNDQELVSTIIDDETRDGKIFCLPEGPEAIDCRSYVNGENGFSSLRSIGEMEFVGAVLQLRGISPVVQPLVDASGNLLVYNGEIFGGLHISSDSNDAEFLLQSLGDCCSCDSLGDISGCARKHIPELLSSIKGPWAMIYWQENTKTLWFGRDAFGRRSLLVHFPTLEDARLLLSSVSPQSPTGFEMEGGLSSLNYWEELPCGVYSMLVDISGEDEGLVGNIKKHEWKDSSLKELISWERVLIEPIREQLNSSSCQPGQKCDKFSKCEAPQFLSSAHRTLAALRKSVARRTTEYSIFQATGHDHRQDGAVPVAILFSGGLDSMILAAILHEGLDSAYGIDLLNVSFEGRSAPDRITGIEGMLELRRIAPFRKWNLVEIDADLSSLSAEMKHVRSLINPAKTYMDLNIGTALWLAAGGDGWMYDGICSHTNETYQPIRYKSEARILLVGSGADEQCAGYGRHRTKYRSGSWFGLHEEMKLDMQRIWKRNLGRDDRCIADNGKEARFPFLDEDVIKTLLDFPLWEIAMLDQPSGTGDKKILREVACLLGIHGAAVLPKRAIQFGTRIAQESNKKNFGSNRAANQASAGSVVFYKSPG